MGLPENKSAWPPAEHTERYSRMATNSTWYGGDPAHLAAMYGGNVGARTEVQNGLKYAISRVFGWFWGKTDPTAPDDKLHVPVAQDIATMSADLLFADSPTFLVQHTEFTEDGTPNPGQDAAVAKTQARLDLLLDNCNFESLLLASAEVASALGSTGLRLGWDRTSGMDMPVITRVDADAIIPEYSWGQLTAVTFWQIVKRDNSTVWYHLERHERGAIYHGLYMGERGNLGVRVPLEEVQATARLAKLVDEDSKIVVEADTTAVSIPNMLPDPLDRMNGAGRSDFTPGVITLFDSIDKTYTSLMRDIEDARSRLIVADYMLESKGAGNGVEFDADQHIFTKLKMQPGDDTDAPITQVQFKIRVDEHIAAIDLLTRTAIENAGYTPDAERANSGGDMTATEYSGKQKRSLTTRKKKLRYWQDVEKLMFGLLQVDAAYFSSGVVPFPVKMVVAPSVQPSMSELAATVALIQQAEASSLRVRVAYLHPDWDEAKINTEVDDIQAESSTVDPSTFGLPTGGNV